MPVARAIHVEVIDDAMAEIYRGMSGSQRLRIASSMFASARKILNSHLRSIHPEWSESQISHEAARRLSHGACGVSGRYDP